MLTLHPYTRMHWFPIYSMPCCVFGQAQEHPGFYRVSEGFTAAHMNGIATQALQHGKYLIRHGWRHVIVRPLWGTGIGTMLALRRAFIVCDYSPDTRYLIFSKLGPPSIIPCLLSTSVPAFSYFLQPFQNLVLPGPRPLSQKSIVALRGFSSGGLIIILLAVV